MAFFVRRAGRANHKNLQSLVRYGMHTILKSPNECSPGQHLQERNILFQCTNNKLYDHSIVQDLKNEHNLQSVSCYAGFDPTSNSLHLGNFLQILTLFRMSFFGFTPIYLIGGATGMIGDPSGKSTERKLLDRKSVEQNIKEIKKLLTTVIKNINSSIEPGHPIHKPLAEEPVIIDNAEFYTNMNIIDFIRDVGKHFRMATLLRKESVAERLKSDEGLSFTEFTYQLLQAYDFQQLMLKHNCFLQLGGSDQWGNITNGIEYIKKVNKRETLGITTPLLVTSSGQKFGKSEGNALWLDAEKTPKNDIYQYILNLSDKDAILYLRLLTFLELDHIKEIELKQNLHPENRLAQKTLAQSILKMIHGESNEDQAHIAKILFETDFSALKNQDSESLTKIFCKISTKKIIKAEKLSQSSGLIDLLSSFKVCGTKTELRRNIEMGGLYINNERKTLDQIKTDDKDMKNAYFLGGKYMVARVGKKNFFVFEIEN